MRFFFLVSFFFLCIPAMCWLTCLPRRPVLFYFFFLYFRYDRVHWKVQGTVSCRWRKNCDLYRPNFFREYVCFYTNCRKKNLFIESMAEIFDRGLALTFWYSQAFLWPLHTAPPCWFLFFSFFFHFSADFQPQRNAKWADRPFQATDTSRDMY